METITANSNAGRAGKPGESAGVAGQSTASTTVDPKNLTPEGVTSLLGSAFAEPAQPPKPGEEMRPAAGGEGDESAGGHRPPPQPATKEPEWSADQQAWFELRAKANTPEEIAAADAQAPEFSDEQRAFIEQQNAEGQRLKAEGVELPAEVLGQVKAWEDAGGALPPTLQAIVDKRIGREVGKVKDLEKRASDAESEVARLKTELDTRGQSAPAAGVGGLDEAGLNKLAETTKRFQADARAVLGGYANEEQKRRLEEHMQKTGQDENALRRQLDTVNDWLAEELPQLRQQVREFRQLESQITPIAASRFPSLARKDTDEAKFAAEALSLVPELRGRTPAHQLALGVYALGSIAFAHLSKASADGDVIARLKDVLSKHVPLPINGKTNGPGQPRFFLPGKAPVKAPAGGSPASTRLDSRKAQAEEQSRRIREQPTAENVTEALATAFRVPVHTE